MVTLLIDRGAGTDWQAKNGLASIHLAAQEDRVSTAKVLINRGARIDIQTKVLYTA